MERNAGENRTIRLILSPFDPSKLNHLKAPFSTNILLNGLHPKCLITPFRPRSITSPASTSNKREIRRTNAPEIIDDGAPHPTHTPVPRFATKLPPRNPRRRGTRATPRFLKTRIDRGSSGGKSNKFVRATNEPNYNFAINGLGVRESGMGGWKRVRSGTGEFKRRLKLPEEVCLGFFAEARSAGDGKRRSSSF